MKTKLISLAMGALLVGCTAASATGNYTITAEIPTDDFEGLTAYLVNFDTGEKIDSTMIDNGKAVHSRSRACTYHRRRQPYGLARSRKR